MSHQILGDYLAEQHEINRNKLHRRRARLITLAGSLALLLTLGIVGYWHAFLAPIPYDARLSAKVYESAVAQYVNAGMLHDTMRGLLSGALSPEECEARLATYGSPLYSTQELVWRQLVQGHGSRSVIPWSGAPLDVETCETLLGLPQERRREYAVYLEMASFARQDERRARDHPGYEPLTTVEQLSAALGAKLDADADEAWLMYQRVLAPHMDGLPEATAADYRDTLLLTSPAYRERMPGTPSMAFAEAAVQKAQRNAKTTLLSLGIGYQYAEELEDAWKYQEE